MPRLLMVATVPRTLRLFLFPLARFFQAKGWRVDAAANGVTSARDCVEVFDEVRDIEWSRNPLDPRNLRTGPRMIRAVVAHGKYDVVHVHTPVAALVTRYALKGLAAKDRPVVVYTAHGFHFHAGGNPFRNQVFRTLEKLAGRWTDYLIVMNEDDEAEARKLGIVPADRLRYMRGIGIDTDFYAPQQVSEASVKAVRDELRLPGEAPMILMVAEFNPGKRHVDALRAFARIYRDSALHLVFVGEGPLRSSMERLAADLGISERCRFLNERWDIPVMIRASVATLLPSVREGLPRCVMESMCLERPVIGSDVRGIRELLGDGAGILVKARDVDGFADAMKLVLEHPEAAQAMADLGRKRMQGPYELSSILSAHLDLYEEALARRVTGT
ncbi:MAG: glycosyltransferase family 4 protein [bacterium]|nr:glycosyltransferase family 4 protein [bacterium]